MNPDRWDRILASVRNRTTPGPLVAHLCTVAKDLLRCDSASICLNTDHGLAPLDGSDSVAVEADNLQILWGVGPTITAATSPHHAHSTASAVSDVTTELDPRWPLLAELHTVAGMRAVAAFGLRTGGAHLGVLSGYNQQPRTLTTLQLADGLVLATLITEVLLGLHAIDTSSAQIGADQFEELLTTTPPASAQIHQAAGIIAERLHISILEGQIRLRALAFRRGDTLDALARQIITHRQIPELED